MRDPYEILGVERSASKEEIRAAYKELAKKYHPDQFQQNPLSDLAEEKFKEINEAYDTLMSGKARGANDYNSGNQSYSGGYQEPSNAEYSSARQFIQRGDYYNAKRILFESRERNAEWNYLMGIISSNTGFYNDAFNYLRTATQMDPANFEYSNAFNNLAAHSNNYQSRGMAYGNQSNDEICRLCSALYCADCCCECSGGDLISCC